MIFAEVDEEWARILVFLIVALYVLVVILLLIRFLLKTFRLMNQSPCLGFPAETQGRNGAPDTPPPSFSAALKYPLPSSTSLESSDPPPPSYVEACSQFRNYGHHIDPKDIVIHI